MFDRWVVLSHLEEEKEIFPEGRDNIGKREREKPIMYVGNIAMWLKHGTWRNVAKL